MTIFAIRDHPKFIDTMPGYCEGESEPMEWRSFAMLCGVAVATWCLFALLVLSIVLLVRWIAGML